MGLKQFACTLHLFSIASNKYLCDFVFMYIYACFRLNHACFIYILPNE